MDNVQYEVRYIVFETLYWSVFENSYYKSETGETKHMIKIAIVEDEAMYAKQLQDFLRQYETENGETFDITIYSDGDQIVHKYKSQPPHCSLLSFLLFSLTTVSPFSVR